MEPRWPIRLATARRTCDCNVTVSDHRTFEDITISLQVLYCRLLQNQPGKRLVSHPMQTLGNHHILDRSDFALIK